MPVDRNLPILVVDDHATMLRIVRNLLRLLGFGNVDEANDGRAALDMLRKGSYALIISDWLMEPVTGLHLLREMRSDSRLNAVPFILMTADSKSESVAAAKEAGVSNYIVKPFNVDTLRRKLTNVFGPLSNEG